MGRRPALTRERVLEAAVSVADEGGIERVTMRSVGRALGVEAMSLYHHVASKDALLDALVEQIFTRIELPDPTAPWRAAMIDRAGSARSVLAAHPWALGLIESRRAPADSLLEHHEAVLATLHRGGFSIALAAHAFSAIDAYVYGFVLTETNLPFEAGEDAAELAADMTQSLDLTRYPHLSALIETQVSGGAYDYGDEFSFGLDLLLDRLEQLRDAEQGRADTAAQTL